MSPVVIPSTLPATEKLTKENIFVMNDLRAQSQDMRPLQILILNLMPTKIVTETQILRLLSNTLIQIELTFLHMATHESKNTPKSHLESFYTTFNSIKERRFDALIVTGAPVENLPFTEVSYWKELTTILDWAETNVYSSLFVCWGAQAALYHYYGLSKKQLPKKACGVFPHTVINKSANLTRGFDDVFYAPHSRYTETSLEDIENTKDLEIIATSPIVGPHIIASLDRRKIFITGHPEYDKETLDLEYRRDLAQGLNPEIPYGYYENDNPSKDIIMTWKGHANLLYANWINYYVYQETEYDLSRNK